jgi:2-oxo-3-hexenedioate decarboxylase
MPNSTAAHIHANADAVLSALADRRSIPPFTRAAGGLTMPDAYRVSRAVTARRRARGEMPVGRKIGFTNPAIWPEYGVDQPLYGPMYDTTMTHAAGPVAAFSLVRFVEPRIEPEIVLGLSAAPAADMDEAGLMACVGWVAHGFEIVQSLYPGWSFGAADCVAGFGMHGALICGPRRAVAAGERSDMLVALQEIDITLSRNGEAVDSGVGRNVLGGPISALRRLVQVLAVDPEAAPLAAGEIVTTGTITRAFPITAGEQWTTTVTGLGLPGLDVTFSA